LTAIAAATTIIPHPIIGRTMSDSDAVAIIRKPMAARPTAMYSTCALVIVVFFSSVELLPAEVAGLWIVVFISIVGFALQVEKRDGYHSRVAKPTIKASELERLKWEGSRFGLCLFNFWA
jgi:hypothetical protein